MKGTAIKISHNNCNISKRSGAIMLQNNKMDARNSTRLLLCTKIFVLVPKVIVSPLESSIGLLQFLLPDWVRWTAWEFNIVPFKLPMSTNSHFNIYNNNKLDSIKDTHMQYCISNFNCKAYIYIPIYHCMLARDLRILKYYITRWHSSNSHWKLGCIGWLNGML